MLSMSGLRNSRHTLYHVPYPFTTLMEHPMKLAQLGKTSTSSTHLEITQNMLHFWLPVWGAWGLSWDTLALLNTTQR